MSFTLGFICGLALGSTLSWLAYSWLDAPDNNQDHLDPCPPCNGHCQQGRDCPSRKNT